MIVMAEKANRRSENLKKPKTRSMEHLTVCCVEVDLLIRTHRRAFHQGQGHRDPRKKVGYMAAACPFRIDNCSCIPGRVIYGFPNRRDYMHQLTATAEHRSVSCPGTDLTIPETEFGQADQERP